MNIRNLTKNYGEKRVVEEVSFEIPKGKVTSFIGPNGAGKSTVLGMLTRLIARDEGIVDLKGKDIKAFKSQELAKKLAILTQQNNVQMKLTVRELVAFGRFPYNQGHNSAEDEKIIDRALSYLELEEYASCYIDELSGGQRQRAFIAMVLAQDTEYIFLDEPTNNLDIYYASKLMRTVRKLSQELGKTVVLVLHEINYASFYSDYICAFKKGRIASFGTAEEVMKPELLKAIYDVNFEVIHKEGRPLSFYY